MNGYWPVATPALIATAILIATTILSALIVSRLAPRRSLRWLSWSYVLASMIAIHLLTIQEPAGFRMLAICSVLLFAMKIVILAESRLEGQAVLPFIRCFSFIALWPGMRPELFATDNRQKLPDSDSMLIKGLTRLILGLCCLLMARLSWLSTRSYVLVTIFMLPGLSLILHFGIFNLVSGFWRWRGVDCQSLFQAPLVSKSLNEFWGRRWNLPFSEMTRLAVYQPLCNYLPKSKAAVAGFVFSGLLHELAISVPVGAGYGLPLLYFALHGILLIIERTLYKKGRPIDSFGWRSRAWTLVWLTLPMPILFHPYFLKGVVWPIIGI